MFGGLDIKGSGDKKDEPSSSGFSFMNGTSSNSAAPAPAPAASGFGFMNNLTAAPEPAPASAPSSSAFGFMSVAPAPAAATATAPEMSAPSSSGFGFMNSSTSAPASTEPKSGFSFMTSPGGPQGAAAAAAAAGAGVSFGGATAQKKTIKRRSRAPKVGQGSTIPVAPTSSYRNYIPEPEPAQPPAPAPAPAPTPPVMDTKAAAEEAANRADQFMATKMLQEKSKLGQVSSNETVTVAGLMAPSSHAYITGKEGEVDEEMEEAMRAAEQAKARLAQEASAAVAVPPTASGSAFSWFSGFKKDPSKPEDGTPAAVPGTGGMNMGASALAAAVQAPPPSAPGAIGGMMEYHDPTAERISKAEKEIKRVMAERHGQMQQQRQDINQADDGTVWDSPPITDSMAVPAAASGLMAPSSSLMAPSSRATSWKAQSDASTTMSAPKWGKHNATITPAPAPAPRLPTPPPPTPKELLDALLSRFSSKVEKAVEGVSDLRQQRNMLLEERFVALAKERLAIQQIAQTEKQQMQAAETEDYEKAERLQVVLEGHQREKAECSAILDNIGLALKELEEQTPKVVDAVSNCFQDVESELVKFEEKQEETEQKADTDAMKRFEKTNKQLNSEDERLKQEFKHLERDEELVKEERKELDQAIGEQTEAMEKSRDEAKTKLDGIEKEIEELREKLRSKETEATQIKMLMESQKSDISKILVKFNRQITRVQKKESSVKEQREEWQNEKTAYQKLKDAHDAEVKAHSDSLLEKQSLRDALSLEISFAKQFRDIIAKEVSLDSNRSDDGENHGDLAQLQADVVECEAAVSEAKSILKAAENELVELDGESKRIEEKLPKLEKEKKEAAAKRDFKTAGKASKEIKEASARLKDLSESLIDEAKAKRKSAQEVLDKAEKALGNKKAIANEKEKETGKVSMEKIAEKIKRLVETKKEVCDDAEGANVKGVGAFVLKGQIETLKLEGQTFGDKFGGWDELMAEINFDEPEEEQEKVVETEIEEGGEVKTDEPEKPAEDEPPSRPSNEVIQENVDKGKELTKAIAKAEAELEEAVSSEDYDKAAELSEAIEACAAAITELNLTDAETDLVMAPEEPTEESADKPTEESEKPTEQVAEEPEKPAEEPVEGKQNGEASPSENGQKGEVTENGEEPIENGEEPTENGVEVN